MVMWVFYWLLTFPLVDSYINETKLRVHLYHSDRMSGSAWYQDCLLYDGAHSAPEYKWVVMVVNRPYQIIPYCIRRLYSNDDAPTQDEDALVPGLPITFQTLMDGNITSEILYRSSVPIDIVERYEAFLEDPRRSSSQQKVYNCSMPWFGEVCQYRLPSLEPFHEIVKNYFRALRLRPKESDPLVHRTCYTFITCDRGPWPSCLDWREICDGKIDCLNGGVDETGCDDLDTNECEEDEYRCANGLCIPDEFFSDDIHNPDCMDASDEKDSYYVVDYSDQCHYDPTFRCEERSCRDPRQEACGDGQCRRNVCNNQRDATLSLAKLAWDANPQLSFDCWMNLICLLVKPYERLPVLNLTAECPSWVESKSIGIAHCPKHFFFPAQPVVLSHVRFLYERNAAFQINSDYEIPLPSYVCYDQYLCGSVRPTIRFNESSCLLFSKVYEGSAITRWVFLEKEMVDFFAQCLLMEKTYAVCPKSKPFRCANSSKCLSLNRVMDGLNDCMEGDDEHAIGSCLLPDHRYRFKCRADNVCMDIKSLQFNDFECTISGEWTGEIRVLKGYNALVSFSQSFATVCDGFSDHLLVNSLNYTDEINCERWPCNNIYTRCDEQGRWNCLNGADEADCPRNPCRPHGHPCLSLQSNTFTCLPLSRINDGIVDCLGAFDERALCRASSNEAAVGAYRCVNGTKCFATDSFCNGLQRCPSSKIDTEWCEAIFIFTPSQCSQSNIVPQIEIWNFSNYLCHLRAETLSPKLLYFTLKNHLTYPLHSKTGTSHLPSNKVQEVLLTQQSVAYDVEIYCKRGILLYANDSNGRYCLCPPAYFGDRCEYQTDRVSLTMQFRTAEWTTMFNLVVMLVDNTTTIHSSEQLEYLAMRDCRKKFNVNLLYSNQSKPANRTYYVRIDVYGKAESKHISSILYPVQFLFLPVYRLSRQVDISQRDSSTNGKDCPLKCMHGQCTRYDNRNDFFCRCLDGYSGDVCSIKNECNCSPGSLCVGTTNNRSICVCPLGKFGPRCYLKQTVCKPNPCAADGQCIPTHARISELRYVCICRSGFTGSNCEHLESTIEFSFAKSIVIPQSMLIHFIDITSWQTNDRFRIIDPTQTTIISKIRFDENFAVVHHNGVFHLIFLQIGEYYYLALLQHNHTFSITASTEIIAENRCPLVSNFLETHIRNYTAWYRARYYHDICRKQRDLQCFHDDDRFMCLCDTERFANCFKFDFKRVYNCFGNNYCENEGRCYQNDVKCPSASSCFCDECYYGTRCQFTSTGYGLSIDNILGYSIWPRIAFARQPKIIHVTTAITLLMFVLSILNGILSIITFRTKKSLTVGSGVYLLSASVASCLTMFLFTLKFLLLISSHISSNMNKSFLVFNCTIMDMFLKSFLAMVDWLYTCVAIERVWTIHKGAMFDKKQSVKLAKRITPVIFLLALGSYTQDAAFRRLLEDVEEQRTWCILRYSPSIKVVSSAINLIHFLVPLSVNLMSVIAIIILLARQKLKVAGGKDQQKHLWAQFKQHKHYLLSSIVLIAVAIPRLVISFMTKCMTTARHPWLYLTAYFFSFISPLLIFVFFALPSEFYRKQFTEETRRIKRSIQRQLGNP